MSKPDGLYCPECGKSNEFDLIVGSTAIITYSDDAQSFDDWGEMEIEDQESQTMVKCRNCQAIVLNVLG